MENNKCVYTFITAGYDDLKEPKIYTPGWDYICVTDNPNLKSNVWQIIQIDDETRKIEPSKKRAMSLMIGYQKWLPKHYDIVVTIGGQCVININLNELLIKYGYDNSYDACLLKHDRRNCIYDEAKAIIREDKDIHENINKQIQAYIDEGYPEKNGLYASGVMIINNNSENIHKYYQQWLSDYLEFPSVRDQMTMNYSEWKLCKNTGIKLNIKTLSFLNMLEKDRDIFIENHRQYHANGMKINLFNTSIKEIKAGFLYSPNKSGFYLRGVLFTGELFEINSIKDHYFVGNRNVFPFRLVNSSHVNELNTSHKYIKNLEMIVYPDELNNDFIVVPNGGKSYNLGPIKNLIDDEFNLHKSEKKLVVIDNFYLNPNEVRDFALSRNFEESETYKGKSTQIQYHTPFIKEKFEDLLGKKIINWTASKFNGSFQYCTSEDKLEYNVGSHDYMGIIFLTPFAPPETGVTLFRCKQTGNYEYEDRGPEYQTTFKFGHYDKTQLEEIDRIGNKFNRLVIFKAKNIHSATEYFGSNLMDSRLFQIFMFDVE